MSDLLKRAPSSGAADSSSRSGSCYPPSSCAPLPFYLDAFWLRIDPVLHGRWPSAPSGSACSAAPRTALPRARLLPRRRRLRVTLWLAGEPGPGLPPAVAAVLAVLLAGTAGGLFSPVAGRGEGHLPRRGHLAPGLPRPPRPAHRRLRHRRLQRTLGAAPGDRRIHLRRDRPRNWRSWACRSGPRNGSGTWDSSCLR